MKRKNATLLYLTGLIVLLATACNQPDNRTGDLLSKNFEPKPQTEQIDSKLFIFPEEANNKCVSCHEGIEPIRDPKSGMMQEIYMLAEKAGFKDNECIVCHGGNPDATDKLNAHNGSVEFFKNNNGPEVFYPNPSSAWINDKTCGMCHMEQVSTQFTSLMFTEAGKIQGTTWGFGGIQGYDHDVANIAVEEVDYHKRLGSDVYKKYMTELKDAEPQVFPKHMKGLPEAPTPEIHV